MHVPLTEARASCAGNRPRHITSWGVAAALAVSDPCVRIVRRLSPDTILGRRARLGAVPVRDGAGPCPGPAGMPEPRAKTAVLNVDLSISRRLRNHDLSRCSAPGTRISSFTMSDASVIREREFLDQTEVYRQILDAIADMVLVKGAESRI